MADNALRNLTLSIFGVGISIAAIIGIQRLSEADGQESRGSIKIKNFSLSQVDSRTVRATLQVSNESDFSVDGNIILFPEWINPDGTFIDLQDQVQNASLEAKQSKEFVFTWQPLFGFELQPTGSKVRVGANYQDLQGNFLVSGQPTKQITV